MKMRLYLIFLLFSLFLNNTYSFKCSNLLSRRHPLASNLHHKQINWLSIPTNGLHKLRLNCQQQKPMERTEPFTLKSSSWNFNRSVFIKALLVFALILQNSGLTIIMRMSKTGKYKSNYISSTAVLLSEIIKFFISLSIYYRLPNYSSLSTQEAHVPQKSNSLINEKKVPLLEIFTDLSGIIPIAVPSFLYVLQNNLQYIATSSLPVALYQVLVQVKLITTAIFSSVLLSKQPSSIQWTSIVFLTIGVIMVQLSITTGSNGIAKNINLPLGIAAVAFSCLTSGLATVQMEKTLKKQKKSLWLRNIQISVVSIALSILACMKDFSEIQRLGFFAGYNPLVIAVILTHAIGGILVSMVVKYIDSIVKGFATSGSIILSCIISSFIMHDLSLNNLFTMGTAIVCGSTIAYSMGGTKSDKVPFPYTSPNSTIETKKQ